MPAATELMLADAAAVWVVAAAAVGALLVLLAVWAAARRVGGRSRGSSEQRLSALLMSLEARMEAMGRELQRELERTREETRRTRSLSELAGSIDLDEVVRRTLEAAGAVPGADAAMITVLGVDDEPRTTSLGLTEREAEEHAFGHPPSGRLIRTITIAYGQPGAEAPREPAPIQVGLAVPIQAEAESIGVLTVFSRGDPRVFSEEQAVQLEDLALRAGPAIDNARRFREARQLADLDALTGLHNRRYFHETLAREVARAQRYARHLALIVLDLDDFKSINDRIGHLAGDTVLARVAERVSDVVRTSDIACRVGGDEFAIVLPESALADAEQLFSRLNAHLSSRPIPEVGRISVSAGLAELLPSDDAVALFQRADEALYRAKEGGKGRAVPAAGGIGPPPQELRPVPGLQAQER